MKRIVYIGLIALVAVNLGVLWATSVDWELIDATGPILLEEDDEIQEFGRRFAALIMGEVHPEDLKPEVRAQLSQMIEDLVVQAAYIPYNTETLGAIQRIWIPVIRENHERIEALEQGN